MDDILKTLRDTAVVVGVGSMQTLLMRAADEIEWLQAEKNAKKQWIIRESTDICDPYVMLPYVLMRLTHKNVYVDYGRFETKESAEYVRDTLNDIV